MKTIYNFIFSTTFMAIILIVFAVSIAFATFIENDFGPAGSKALVYNALWFEILLFLLVINLTGITIRHKLYKIKKLTIFTFHISFTIIILGAGISRFTGLEGMMHIREADSSNKVVTSNSYIDVYVKSGNEEKHVRKKVILSTIRKLNVNRKFSIDGKQLQVKSLEIIPNATRAIEVADEGYPVIEMVSTMSRQRKNYFFAIDEERNVQGMSVYFGKEIKPEFDLNILFEDNKLFFKSRFDVKMTNMMSQSTQMLVHDSIHPLFTRSLYHIGDVPVVLSNFYPSGKMVYKPSSTRENQEIQDAISFLIKSGNEQKEISVLGEKNAIGQPTEAEINGLKVQIRYGAGELILPFSIKLLDFIVERYPGSNSPSWFESKVMVQDEEKNIKENRRIYMNNILKHRGYRFYQSSYDPDERGTILSVNYDFVGSLVTYIGYFFMALGMTLSIFNRNSRFLVLSNDINKLRNKRKSILQILIVLYFISTDGVNANKHFQIDKNHAEKFGKLLVQDKGGRIEPLNTLNSEILRKMYRKDTYKGLNADQVILGMLAFPQKWQDEPIIRISHPELEKILEIDGKYARFNDFFVSGGHFQYKLRKYVEEAYRKKPAFRNKFDTRLIKADERLNVCYMAYTGNFLRIFPNPNDSTDSWVSPAETHEKFSDKDTVFVKNIFQYYLNNIQSSVEIQNWEYTDSVVNSISFFQQKYGADLLPPVAKTNIEIFYNRADIFHSLSSIYGLIGFILLILYFISILYVKLNLTLPIKISTIIIVILFVFHAVGLGLRWYVAGHAPWSNGYEALTFIAWATVLSGIIFARKSGITLAVTAILSWVILHVAHMSWLDPEITNLVPVLKSYWLVIHVAIITASYGFLGLGALMALVNLLLMFFESEKNKENLELTIKEFTNIIEMTLIVGLYLLAIGTFLGGVWANESWGRYWGWDPKETWALVTVLVYAFILHMHLVKGLRSIYSFNLLSLLGYSSVIMTYFGVNYYLSGLHSYAAGDPLPIPSFVYYTVVTLAIIAILSYMNRQKVLKET
ncbi:cytochrome c biogenesis protein CcsA [Bacteroidota bacterium]